MKFLEAENKLKEIAGNEYHSIRYEKTVFHTGELETCCELYIAGHGIFTGVTWEEAFTNCEIKLGLLEKPIEDSPEI